MDYKDLNEINFLTIKTDFILDICDKGEKVGTNLRMFKELGVQYEEVFRMMLKSIEALKASNFSTIFLLILFNLTIEVF